MKCAPPGANYAYHPFGWIQLLAAGKTNCYVDGYPTTTSHTTTKFTPMSKYRSLIKRVALLTIY